MEKIEVQLNIYQDKTSKPKMLINTSYNIQCRKIQEMI